MKESEGGSKKLKVKIIMRVKYVGMKDRMKERKQQMSEVKECKLGNEGE